jgi:hypothetical protein
MKPSYFTRPIQSDRNSHTYGHTVLTPEFDPRRGTIRTLLLVVGLFALLPFLACLY